LTHRNHTGYCAVCQQNIYSFIGPIHSVFTPGDRHRVSVLDLPAIRVIYRVFLSAT
jgi:hypothetical protein